MAEAIIVASITGLFALIGTTVTVYFSQKKSTALITYRIDQLEEKVKAHNNLIERVYILERDQCLIKEKLKGG